MSDWDNSIKQSKRMFEGSGPGSQHAWGKKRKVIRQRTLALKWPELYLPRIHFSLVSSLEATSVLGMIEQNEVVSSEGTGVATSEQAERLMKGNARSHHPQQLGHFGPGPGKMIRANEETRRHPGDASAWHTRSLTTQLPLSRQKTLD